MPTLPKPQPENKFLDYLKANKRSRLIDFPEWDELGKPLLGKIMLKELPSSEHERIQRVAAEECDFTFKAEAKVFAENSFVVIQRFTDRFGNIAAKHFIAAFCYDPETNKKVFPTPDDAATLNNNQLDYLYKAYTEMLEGKPYFSDFTGDEIDKAVDTLANAAEEDAKAFLSRLLPEAQKQLLRSLAKQLWSLKTDNYLLTSLQNESATVPSNEAKSQ